MIAGQGAKTSFSGKLHAGRAAYNVWIYAARQSREQTFAVTDMTTNATVSAAIPTESNAAGFKWVKLGTLTYDPSHELFVYTANAGTGYLQAWRGLYLTQGAETPTAVKGGQSGDSFDVQ